MSDPEAVWTGRFEPTPESVASVRHFVAAHLQGLSSACAEAVVLIASELATNVVRHAQTAYRVRLLVGERVVIEVLDRGGGVPEIQRPSSDAPGGVGLLLVSRLAADWGFEQRNGTKTVWAEVPCGSAQR